MIVEGSIKIPFRYAVGRIGSSFLAALRDAERILGSKCAHCSRVSCPPRSFCSGCGEATEDLVPVGPCGTLQMWTELPDRGVFGIVLLEGADTGLLHRLLVPAGSLRSGLRVRARFATDRTGGIEDLAGFAEEGESS